MSWLAVKHQWPGMAGSGLRILASTVMSESALPGLNDIYDKEINLADGGLVRIELQGSLI